MGGCNPRADNIRLNTELVKKPRDLLEYVLVHEMLNLLDQHVPAWREARAELNALPLGDEMWTGAVLTRPGSSDKG